MYQTVFHDIPCYAPSFGDAGSNHAHWRRDGFVRGWRIRSRHVGNELWLCRYRNGVSGFLGMATSLDTCSGRVGARHSSDVSRAYFCFICNPRKSGSGSSYSCCYGSACDLLILATNQVVFELAAEERGAEYLSLGTDSGHNSTTTTGSLGNEIIQARSVAYGRNKHKCFDRHRLTHCGDQPKQRVGSNPN